MGGVVKMYAGWNYDMVFKKSSLISLILMMLVLFPIIVVSIDEKEKLNMERKEKIKKIEEIFERRKKEIRFHPDKGRDKIQREITDKEFKPYGELVIEVLLPKLNMRNITYKRFVEEIYAIRQIFIEMEEYAFPYLLKKKNEKEPYLRGSIIRSIVDSDYKESILVLVEALDDKEICEWEMKDCPKWEPGGGKLKRICDIAYDGLLWRLGKDIFYEEIRKLEREINSVIVDDGQYRSRDKRIQMFKNWWQKNKERILSKYKEF